MAAGNYGLLRRRNVDGYDFYQLDTPQRVADEVGHRRAVAGHRRDWKLQGGCRRTAAGSPLPPLHRTTNQQSQTHAPCRLNRSCLSGCLYCLLLDCVCGGVVVTSLELRLEIAGSIPGVALSSGIRVSCSHTFASVAKQNNLVPA